MENTQKKNNVALQHGGPTEMGYKMGDGWFWSGLMIAFDTKLKETWVWGNKGSSGFSENPFAPFLEGSSGTQVESWISLQDDSNMAHQFQFSTLHQAVKKLDFDRQPCFKGVFDTWNFAGPLQPVPESQWKRPPSVGSGKGASDNEYMLLDFNHSVLSPKTVTFNNTFFFCWYRETGGRLSCFDRQCGRGFWKRKIWRQSSRTNLFVPSLHRLGPHGWGLSTMMGSMKGASNHLPQKPKKLIGRFLPTRLCQVPQNLQVNTPCRSLWVPYTQRWDMAKCWQHERSFWYRLMLKSWKHTSQLQPQALIALVFTFHTKRHHKKNDWQCEKGF